MRLLISLFLFLAPALVAVTPASAQTRILQLAYEAEDGAPVTGFFYRDAETPDDAPVALLMHGLTGSALQWLATDNRSYGDELALMLLRRGYRVAALDARAHGARPESANPIARVMAAREGDTGAYREMITETIGDYRQLLDLMDEEAGGPTNVLVVGYSMGAQMATWLAAEDPRVTHVVTLVPPAVANVPEVAPLAAAPRVDRPWLLITATDDVFATPEQNMALAEAGGEMVTQVSFESGHRLPQTYIGVIEAWLHEHDPRSNIDSND
ncbi:alpha/beta fold hydrolase [Parasphingopyxis sp.]|uniref:alpha/beta hydrolase n=1 Tax=Parasphingopyxis sp. TaxID=1920299 RepID=UPI00261842F8|nr:alpha/beta fold hydrolase [Parasphingopyxis sp.]